MASRVDVATCLICGRKFIHIEQHLIRCHNTSKIVKTDEANYRESSHPTGKVHVLCTVLKGKKICGARLQDKRLVYWKFFSKLPLYRSRRNLNFSFKITGFRNIRSNIHETMSLGENINFDISGHISI